LSRGGLVRLLLLLLLPVHSPRPLLPSPFLRPLVSLPEPTPLRRVVLERLVLVLSPSRVVRARVLLLLLPDSLCLVLAVLPSPHSSGTERILPVPLRTVLVVVRLLVPLPRVSVPMVPTMRSPTIPLPPPRVRIILIPINPLRLLLLLPPTPLLVVVVLSVIVPSVITRERLPLHTTVASSSVGGGRVAGVRVRVR